MNVAIKEVDKVEILTLTDNYIDLLSQDNTEIVQRAMPTNKMEFRNCILAEHGFSSLITVSTEGQNRSMLFDFGFSDHSSAFNADTLNADLKSVEVMALSHGHIDHTGGLMKMAEKVGKKGIKLVLHPAAFRDDRFIKITDDIKITLLPFSREKADDAGIELVESTDPYGLMGDSVYFLGEIPRMADFEKGAPNFRYVEKGEEKQDLIDDDTAIVVNIKGKGLVVLSGCAHSGIVNTVQYARQITGVENILAVMGGFHLSGADFDAVVNPTINALKEIDPDYIIPTHCTGRDAIMAIEKEMPEKFILNMAGTKLTFATA
jgi:7,8-dihydropterin-6-yl-methyl-4-(beta-D-ribofuranosyl)aminobenzene 5'-phosphate synthase